MKITHNLNEPYTDVFTVEIQGWKQDQGTFLAAHAVLDKLREDGLEVYVTYGNEEDVKLGYVLMNIEVSTEMRGGYRQQAILEKFHEKMEFISRNYFV